MTENSAGAAGREQWLRERRSGIGGSDAAAILGRSPWSSPFAVWAEKTGRLPDRPDTESMRLGRDLEDYVARRWCEVTGKRVRKDRRLLRCPGHPVAIAHIDRRVVGEKAGLECKTTGALNLCAFRGGEYPMTYYTQCMHYIAVTGAARWYLAVLVPGRGFFTYTVERDEDEIAELLGAEEDFWRCVASDTPPAADASEATAEALTLLYPAARKQNPADLTGLEDDLRGLLSVRARIRSLRLDEALHENRIKAAMGEAESGRAGPYSVLWKNRSRRSFDTDAFAADHPELDLARYNRVTAFRQFEIKGESVFAHREGED